MKGSSRPHHQTAEHLQAEERVGPWGASTWMDSTSADGTTKHAAPQTFSLPEMLSYCLSSDLSTILFCSENAEKILGCPIHQVRSHGGILLKYVHFDDRFRVLNALEEALLLKKPVVVSYRWEAPNKKEQVILVNHCVAAHSDFGEVITGVIFRISAPLYDELSLLFERDPRNLSPSREPMDGEIFTLLNDQLSPIGDSVSSDGGEETSATLRRCVPFLAIEKEEELLQALATEISDGAISEPKVKSTNAKIGKGSVREASRVLFSGERVYRAVLRRVEKDTFSPHYVFRLIEVTTEYIREQELRSLRALRSNIGVSTLSLAELSDRLSMLERPKSGLEHRESGSDYAREQISACREEISATLATLSRSFDSPFLSGRELLFQCSEPFAVSVPSEVPFRVSLEDANLKVWRSVGTELLAHVRQISSQISSLAEVSEELSLTLGPSGSESFQLVVELVLAEHLKKQATLELKALNSVGEGTEGILLSDEFSLLSEQELSTDGGRYTAGRCAVRIVITSLGVISKR